MRSSVGGVNQKGWNKSGKYDDLQSAFSCIAGKGGWCYVGILLFCVSLILRLSISRVGFFLLLLWLETPNACFVG